MPKDFSHLPHTDDERLHAAYVALSAIDKQAPTVRELAAFTGVDVETVRAWVANQE